MERLFQSQVSHSKFTHQPNLAPIKKIRNVHQFQGFRQAYKRPGSLRAIRPYVIRGPWLIISQSEGGGADYAHQFTTCNSEFPDLPSALHGRLRKYLLCILLKYVCIVCLP